MTRLVLRVRLLISCLSESWRTNNDHWLITSIYRQLPIHWSSNLLVHCCPVNISEMQHSDLFLSGNWGLDQTQQTMVTRCTLYSFPENTGAQDDIRPYVLRKGSTPISSLGVYQCSNVHVVYDVTSWPGFPLWFNCVYYGPVLDFLGFSGNPSHSRSFIEWETGGSSRLVPPGKPILTESKSLFNLLNPLWWIHD